MNNELKVYNDKEKKCVKCGNIFTFEAGEQYFYEKQGYPEPKICPECRNERKLRKAGFN